MPTNSTVTKEGPLAIGVDVHRSSIIGVVAFPSSISVITATVYLGVEQERRQFGVVGGRREHKGWSYRGQNKRKKNDMKKRKTELKST